MVLILCNSILKHIKFWGVKEMFTEDSTYPHLVTELKAWGKVSEVMVLPTQGFQASASGQSNGWHEVLLSWSWPGKRYPFFLWTLFGTRVREHADSTVEWYGHSDIIYVFCSICDVLLNRRDLLYALAHLCHRTLARQWLDFCEIQIREGPPQEPSTYRMAETGT